MPQGVRKQLLHNTEKMILDAAHRVDIIDFPFDRDLDFRLQFHQQLFDPFFQGFTFEFGWTKMQEQGPHLRLGFVDDAFDETHLFLYFFRKSLCSLIDCGQHHHGGKELLAHGIMQLPCDAMPFLLEYFFFRFIADLLRMCAQLLDFTGQAEHLFPEHFDLIMDCMAVLIQK
ncbi:hypothetical protein SDC9_113450 [bioreactor metagenome]|uniref:Uncharacterized protein n=1 Tax=bioreactor metagenome TaxID=1076179 RepID=A0A645BPN1_9ZZZZ